MPLRDEMLVLRLLIYCHDLLPGSCEKLDGKGKKKNLKLNSGKMAIPSVQKLSEFSFGSSYYSGQQSTLPEGTVLLFGKLS